LLRFHPHPSHRRSIGQTIGLTAYPPQRVAIFKTPTASLAVPLNGFDKKPIFLPGLKLQALARLLHV